ncbi:MAG: NAD(P)H-dependent oxidoreductase [Bacteroidales bacterium]|jgi:flavodoxin|nr:NAD(P)H-dependent oxidoreductase [Bacteroidales bacterium]
MDTKILIAYFSWTGNTRTVAGQIQKTVGGNLFEIKTVKPYPANYNECVNYAKKEQQNNARPALEETVKDFDSYNIIFTGYPNWWGTIPMPLFTFFESYDFSGKTVVPFCTHGGGRLGRSVSDIKKLCPNTAVLEAIAIDGSSVRRAQKEVDEWLHKLKIEK